jgi:Leucine-rich repeat (LRR) protein
LANLDVLDISGNRLTSSGLIHLRDLPRLTELNLSSTQVEIVELLRHLTTIQRLLLNGTPVDNVGLAAVIGFRDLDLLDLSRTRIGEAGLVHLAGLHSLTTLNLSGTKHT